MYQNLTKEQKNEIMDVVLSMVENISGRSFNEATSTFMLYTSKDANQVNQMIHQNLPGGIIRYLEEKKLNPKDYARSIIYSIETGKDGSVMIRM